MYRKNRKLVEEKAGRQFKDDMTPARAAAIRQSKIEGAKTNKEERQAVIANKAQQGKWTIDRIWNSYESQREKTVSLKTDISRYKKYIEKPLGNKELKDLVPLDIDQLCTDLLKNKSPQTVKHVLGIIKRLHYFSIKKNLAPGLSFAIDMPKVDNRKTEFLTQEQITALLQATETSEHIIAGAMMKIALYTGMRRGEMFNLKWDDIDFERGIVFLRDQKSRESQKIPLNDAAVQVFKRLPRSSKYVFPGRGGRKRISITREVNKIKKEAGLPKDFRPLQGLRHTYASMLAHSGQVDMYTLQKLLTHKSPQMIQRYTHLRDETLQKAADLAGDLIGQAVKKKSKQEKPKQLKITTVDIDQYDISKKVVKKVTKKKVEKKEKTSITGPEQLKMF